MGVCARLCVCVCVMGGYQVRVTHPAPYTPHSAGLLHLCVFDVSVLPTIAFISWVSVYPDEAEILFPPLTYLKYASETKTKSSRGSVVDVKPSCST